MNEHLGKFIAEDKDKDKDLLCYEQTDLTLQHISKKPYTDAIAYDLLKILEDFDESYEVSRNISLGGHDAPRIISHWGNDYLSKSGGQQGHSFPAIGHDDQPGSYLVDAQNKRLLYNQSAMVGGRDSYFLSKNNLHTTFSPEEIVKAILEKGYRLYQSFTIGSSLVKPFSGDAMKYVLDLTQIENAFFKATGYARTQKYLLGKELTVKDIETQNLPARSGRPNHNSIEELIDILKAEHRVQK